MKAMLPSKTQCVICKCSGLQSADMKIKKIDENYHFIFS